MRNNLKNKIVGIVAILAFFVYGIFFGMHAPKSGSLKSLITDNIHLGLDLRGGTHLVLQVMVNEAVSTVTDNDVARIQADLQKANLTFSSVAKLDPAHPEVISISGTAPEKTTDVRTLLESNYGTSYDTSLGPNNTWQLNMKHQTVLETQASALTQSIATIRSRIDTLGNIEPVIQQYGLGDNEILVELPGITDPERVRQLIQSTARLEIHAVEPNPSGADPSFADQASAQQAALANPNTFVSSTLDGRWYVLDRTSVVAGTDFRSAQPSQDVNGRPDVVFYLTNAAGDKFFQYTSANIQKMMAITLDGRIREAATIQAGIHDTVSITGGFTEESARDLSTLLSTGSLPASINYLEERTVGPSLGASSIRHGVTAAIAGMLAVMVFMLIYYRGAGINADLALFLNLVILLGFMGFVGSTLTLPGIAGVILTIGMGVDSNVLIFERIREELHLGKSAVAAVDQGFKHALVTIIDTHVTTIVSALILFIFGTGPVRGFAVTLSFGLAANLFTAVFVSRVIFDSILQRKDRGAALSI